jgi:hypothetical protein
LSRVFGTSLPDLFRLLAKVASTIHPRVRALLTAG